MRLGRRLAGAEVTDGAGEFSATEEEALPAGAAAKAAAAEAKAEVGAEGLAVPFSGWVSFVFKGAAFLAECAFPKNCI